MPEGNDQTMFIRADSKDSRVMNDALSDFMAGNPLLIKAIERVVKGNRSGWIITFESE